MGFGLLNGIPRTQGFEETANTDGSIKVEYVGSTNAAAVVQEMTLLRAAELAREAGKAGFRIVERSDYQRFMVQSQYNIEMSRTPTGFKTELIIELVDEASSDPLALDAIAVIDELGPLYYSE